MHIGLVGLPRAGKTTLFNLLTGLEENTDFNPAASVHTGSAVVPDERVAFLESVYKPRKTVYARMTFNDIPGVRMNESGLRAAKLLDEVRAADALVQVVKAFKEEGGDEPTPYSDLEDYRTDLILSDMDALEKRIERIKSGKKIKKDGAEQLAVLEKLLDALGEDRPLSGVQLDEKEIDYLAGQSFLSEKPLIVAVNIDENQLSDGDYPQRDRLISYGKEQGTPVIEICARAEMEISRLAPDDREEFMADLGLKESGLGRLAKTAYDLLGLISFFTVGEDEVRAWTIKDGDSAKYAAGRIHSDIEQGFIRAEVFHYDDIFVHGTASKVREAGLFRLEGKEYKVRDGDIMSIRFNI